MKIVHPDGVRSNKLRCNTTPITTANNSNLGSVCNIINIVQTIVLGYSFSSLNLQCWSHDKTIENSVNIVMNGTEKQWREEEE